MDSIKTYTSLLSLSTKDQELLTAATNNLKLAYAPYSMFLVGAALRTREGHIVNGANQENASYSLCMCAERIALYNKSIVNPDVPVEVIAVRASSDPAIDKPAPPCGACLQVIAEYEERQGGPIRILLQGDGDVIYEAASVNVLLPFVFDSSFLR